MSPPHQDMPSSPDTQPRMMAFPSVFRSTAAPEAIDDNGQDCFWSLQRCDAFDEDDDDIHEVTSPDAYSSPEWAT
jgi:hypothetical protein